MEKLETFFCGLRCRRFFFEFFFETSVRLPLPAKPASSPQQTWSARRKSVELWSLVQRLAASRLGLVHLGAGGRGDVMGRCFEGKETARRLRRRKGLPIESCDLSNRRKYRQTPPKKLNPPGRAIYMQEKPRRIHEESREALPFPPPCPMF